MLGVVSDIERRKCLFSIQLIEGAHIGARSLVVMVWLFHSQVGWEGNCYLLKLFLPAFAAAIAGEGGRHHRVLELVRQVE